MASFVYNLAAKQIADGTIDLDNDTLKVMLVTSSYVADRDDDYVEEGANDANEHEIDGTNYTKGYGSASRKTLANPAITEDDANDRAKFDADNLVAGGTGWTALGADCGTIAAAIVIKEVTNDAASILVIYHGLTSTPCNGGDIGITWHANGLAYMATA